MANNTDLYTINAALINKSKRELEDGLDKNPIDKLRLICLSRGATGLLGLGRFFRNMDTDGNKLLSLEEFTLGIRECGLVCSNEEICEMFKAFDEDNDDLINVTELLLKLRPPIPEYRLDILENVFEKMNKSDDDTISVKDIKKAYNSRNHPKYLNGDMTENEILIEFLHNFDGAKGDKDGRVTKEEFFNYYSIISAAIDEDGYFDLLLRRAFHM